MKKKQAPNGGMRPALWTAMFPQLSVEAAIQELSEAGFVAAELCGDCLLRELMVDPDWKRRAVRIGHLCEHLGLTLTQAHGPNLQYSSPDSAVRAAACIGLEEVYPILRTLGIGTVVVHAGQEGGVRETSKKGWQGCLDRNVDSFGRLVGKAKSFGIRIAVENVIDGKGPGRRVFGAHPMDLEVLFERVPGLGLNLDTAHANAQNLDIPAIISRFAPRLFGLHVSDNQGEFFDCHLIPGKGIIEWKAVIAALRDAGYAGDFHLELPHERDEGDTNESIQKNRQTAREAFGVAERMLADS